MGAFNDEAIALTETSSNLSDLEGTRRSPRFVGLEYARINLLMDSHPPVSGLEILLKLVGMFCVVQYC